MWTRTLKLLSAVFRKDLLCCLLRFLIFINDITECSNQFKYILYADDSTLSTCIPGDNVMDSAELINSELKYHNRWLKSNQISISVDKTKYMLLTLRCFGNELYNRGPNTVIAFSWRDCPVFLFVWYWITHCVPCIGCFLRVLAPYACCVIFQIYTNI